MDQTTSPSKIVNTADRLFTQRLNTVDILRGLIMVIMALDHVREYFGPTAFRAEDPTQTSTALFFTRWITHFCAPLFLLISGVSAYLYNQKYGNKKTSFFLLTRGVWLILLELIAFSFILQWSYSMILLSIIWAIGWSMLFLSLALWLPRGILLFIATAIIILHNLLPIITPVNITSSILALLHNTPFVFMIAKLPVLSAYTIFPWAAVMMLGYAIGPYIKSSNALPVKRWLLIGISMIVAFVLIRYWNSYGDPLPWSVQERGGLFTVISFLNLNKYPASLLFLLLTLGGGAVLWYICSRWQNRFTAFLEVYGRVPFFYFLLHFIVVSGGAYLWTRIAFGQPYNLSFMTPADWPAAYQPSLLRVYICWMLVVLLLYYPCKWFGKYKAKSKSWWLSYL